MALTEEGFEALVLRGQEQIGAEFKAAGDWDQYWQKVVKAALAFPNLDGGGYFIIGVDDEGDDRLTVMGVTPAQRATFQYDHVSAKVHAYADPFVDLDVYALTLSNGKILVVIEFEEFTDVPVIAKKALDDVKVRHGGIYVRRRHGGVATSELANQSEMRTLLDLATRKMLRSWQKHATAIADATGAMKAFDDELGGGL